MSLPVTNDLLTLDYVYNGTPFVYVESKNTLNTVSLDTIYDGVPFVATLGNAPLVGSTYNAYQFFMVF